MEHHGVLDGEGAASGKDALIVRGAVLARVGDAALLHGLSGLFHIPALGLRAGEGDAVQGVQMDEEVHHRGGDEINMIQRLAQQNDVLGQVVHLGGPFRDDEEPPGVRDVDHHIAALIAVGGKLGGIVQRIAVVEHEGCCIGRGGLVLPAARKGEGGGRQGFQEIAAFHRYFASIRDAEAKVSVYSISCGVLMATVSPTTSSGVSRAVTGISKVELPSVLVGRYFSPSTSI